MKNLIFINGTMGAGKTTVSRELQELLQPSVMLDGDWCWDMRPFTVTEETKRMVIGNISAMLNGFLGCTEFENIIFCWVMHEESIIRDILDRLDLSDANFMLFTLTLSEAALRLRLERDIAAGLRSEDIISRSTARLPLYGRMRSEKIDVSVISAAEAARSIAGRVLNK